MPHHPASPGTQDITDPATGLSRLLSRKCATCILAPGDRMHLGPEHLRELITRTLAAGSFVVCHDTLTYGDHPEYGPAICRGFHDAYAGSPALTLLRAFGRLTEVPPPGTTASPAPPPGSRKITPELPARPPRPADPAIGATLGASGAARHTRTRPPAPKAAGPDGGQPEGSGSMPGG